MRIRHWIARSGSSPRRSNRFRSASSTRCSIIAASRSRITRGIIEQPRVIRDLLAAMIEQRVELADHCRKQVPYYARLLNDAGFANRPIENLADLRRLPLLT